MLRHIASRFPFHIHALSLLVLSSSCGDDGASEPDELTNVWVVEHISAGGKNLSAAKGFVEIHNGSKMRGVISYDQPLVVDGPVRNRTMDFTGSLRHRSGKNLSLSVRPTDDVGRVAQLDLLFGVSNVLTTYEIKDGDRTLVMRIKGEKDTVEMHFVGLMGSHEDEDWNIATFTLDDVAKKPTGKLTTAKDFTYEKTVALNSQGDTLTSGKFSTIAEAGKYYFVFTQRKPSKDELRCTYAVTLKNLDLDCESAVKGSVRVHTKEGYTRGI